MKNLSIQQEKQLSWFKETYSDKALVEKLKSIDLLICDIDGSLTSGHLVCSDKGNESKLFSVIDGLGIAMWRSSGLTCGVISKRNSMATQQRMQGLGVPKEICLLGVEDKTMALTQILKATEKTTAHTLVWGDDVPDFELKKTGVMVACPAQAPFYLAAQADMVLPLEGGNHALRLLTDFILYVKGKHPYQEVLRELCG